MILGTGELYLDCVLHDLRKMYSEIGGCFNIKQFENYSGFFLIKQFKTTTQRLSLEDICRIL